MAIKQVRIKKKQDDGTWLKVHPETESGITLFDPDYSSLESTNVQDAIDELSEKVDHIDASTVDSINGLQGTIKIEAGNKIEVTTSSDDGSITISTNNVALNSDLQEHKSNFDNPHNVNKAQVGLGNVDNTSDLDKPVSNATQLALEAEAIRSNNYTDNLSNDVYHKNEIKNIALTGSADDVSVREYEGILSGSVQNSLEYLVRAIGTGGTGSVVDVVKQPTPDPGFLSTYYVTQGNKLVGEKINIPITDVQPDQPKVQLTKNEDGLLGATVIEESLEKTDLTEELQNEISGKQDQLTAGENIEITDNVIKAIVPEVTTPEVIKVTREVGGYKVNDIIPAGTLLFDIIKQILQPAVPVGQTFLYWYTGGSIPTSITNEFEEEESTEEIVETGKIHYFSPSKEYIAFAFNKNLGELKHVYQNDLTMFDLLADFSKIEVMKDGITYYLYYVTEKLMGDNDKYEFLWR